MINKILNIINSLKEKDFNKNTTENKVLEKIDKILLDGPIDYIKTRDDFIKYLFKVYFYKWKYRPFISYIEIFFRYYIIILLISLFLVPLWGGFIFNIKDKSIDYKGLWILLSNIMYVSILFYIPIRIYYYIIKLIRKEIKNKLSIIIGLGIIKIILFVLLIPLTWFIGTFFASLINVIGLGFEEISKIILYSN